MGNDSREPEVKVIGMSVADIKVRVIRPGVIAPRLSQALNQGRQCAPQGQRANI